MSEGDVMQCLVPVLHRRHRGERGWVISYRLEARPRRFRRWLFVWAVRPMNRLLCRVYGHTDLLRKLWLVYGISEPRCSHCNKDIRQPGDVAGTKKLPDE